MCRTVFAIEIKWHRPLLHAKIDAFKYCCLGIILMVFNITVPANISGWLSIIKIVVSIVTLIYAFDILILHRKFSDLGKAMASNVTVLTLGIFILILSFAVDSFNILKLPATIGEIIGIVILGVYFRGCVHSYIKKTGGEFWERMK